jgi:hypothetical protein
MPAIPLEGTMRGLEGRSLFVALLLLSAPVLAQDAKRVDVKNLSCEAFLAQPDDIRPMLVAWVHGYSHASGENWVVDPAAARAFVASVETRCKAAPKGSFRYQVLETAKERQAQLKKAAKK